MPWARTISLTLGTLLVPLSTGCVLAVVDDMADGGDTSSDSADSYTTSSSSASTSTTEPSSGGEAGTHSGGSSGDGDGDGEPGDGDGEPCGPYPTTEVPECPEIVGEGFCSEGGGHVDIGTEIMWMHNPPHSGPHFPVWSSWGEKTEPVERGYWVHNLEHGAIVLIYNCPEPGANGCQEELDVLRELMAQRPEHRFLLTPDPLLEGSTYAALSWTWVYGFESPDLAQLLCFVDQHYDHAPESVL